MFDTWNRYLFTEVAFQRIVDNKRGQIFIERLWRVSVFANRQFDRFPRMVINDPAINKSSPFLFFFFVNLNQIKRTRQMSRWINEWYVNYGLPLISSGEENNLPIKPGLEIPSWLIASYICLRKHGNAEIFKAINCSQYAKRNMIRA